MKLGISGQALENVHTFSEIAAIGKRYGVTHFEIWPSNVSGEGAGYEKRDVSEIRKIAQELDITIACVTLGAAFQADAWNSPEEYADLLMSAIEAAKELDCHTVNHYCYALNRSEEVDFSVLERAWLKPLEMAKKSGVVLCLENEAHDATRTPEGMRSILSHFEDDHFKTTFDATNYLHASCEAFPAAYEILKPYIGYVHLKNGCLYRPEAGQESKDRGGPMSGHYAPSPIQYAPLPDGAVNIAGLVQRLKEDDQYHGVCTLEPHTVPERVEMFYERETGWLRQLGYFL
ncbi:MAG: sugar phosphate isomerase/epimerase family protein [Candidatus Merdivicinus sp.]|jgi:sugar phosphate isomerase/epimerase